MGKHKDWCSRCEGRHYPPTGKKCKLIKNDDHLMDPEHSLEGSVGASSFVMDSDKSHATRWKNNTTVSKSARGGQNCKVKGAKPLGHSNEEVAPDGSGLEDVQGLILQELKRVNQRLDVVEGQMAAGSSSQGSSKKDYQKLSKKAEFWSKNYSKVVDSTSDSSDEEVEIPTLAEMRVSAALQKKIDSKIGSLVSNKSDKGNDHNQNRPHKSNWVRNSEYKKPWYCKP